MFSSVLRCWSRHLATVTLCSAYLPVLTSSRLDFYPVELVDEVLMLRCTATRSCSVAGGAQKVRTLEVPEPKVLP